MKITYTDSQIKEKLRTLLSPKRYIHTIGVSETAKKLARLYGEDEDKAYLAGLLHDCAKYMSIDEQLEKCNTLGVEIDLETRLCTPVIHAPLGAQMANREYDIDDEDILNAIRFHTVAREGMSRLEKIIYIADMIEPSREYDEVEDLRRISETNLDKAMLKCLSECIMFNIKKGKAVHSNSIKCYNELICKEAK